MANEEQLAFLKQGVEVWNEWRKANPDVKPDLRKAALKGADLKGINFKYSDLGYADLTDANLFGADLRDAGLNWVKLIEANLKLANLNNANLWKANLIDANLSNAILSHANLSSAFLRDANLKFANLSGAILCSADLTECRALYTNFKGATLTGALIQDWKINVNTNLNGAICDYIYSKLAFEGFSERRPHTGNFASGEFAKLVQQSLNTIDLIFREGLDWKAFAYSFKQVEVLHGDAHLEVRSIENKGDGVVIVKVAAAPDANKALIHSDFTQLYEVVSKTLAAQYEARLVDKDTQLREQSTYINRLLRLVNSSEEVKTLMAKQRSGDHYYGDIHAGNFTPHGSATGGVYNDFSNTQGLAQAASQIQALLAQLQQQGHSPEEAQQQVANDLAEQAKKDPTTLGKLVMWGQKLADATVTDVVKGVVKMALRAAGVPLP